MSIKKIARIAGVAQSTVSRVLNHSGYVSEEVRQRVEQIIADEGYVPNAMAKSLKGKRSDSIGILIPQLSSESMARTAEGITAEAAARGYHTILANASLSTERELYYLRNLPSRQLDGLLFMATNITQAHLDLLAALTIPVVILGQRAEGFTSIIHDDGAAGAAITRDFIARGRKKLAYIGITLEDEAVRHLRYGGFLAALSEHGLCQMGYAEGDFSLGSGYTAMAEIWAQGLRPDGVIAANDRMAVGAMNFLRQQGCAVPENVAVAGFGNNQLSDCVSPRLTTVDYCQEEAGRQAAAILLTAIEGGQPHVPQVHTLPHVLLHRESSPH